MNGYKTASTPARQEIIQPVAKPILCGPFAEPDRHWVYDTHSGEAPQEMGRRPASYWYKTRRAGLAQLALLVEEERDDLPLVNLLREDVKCWREANYRNAYGTMAAGIRRFRMLSMGFPH